MVAAVQEQLKPQPGLLFSEDFRYQGTPILFNGPSFQEWVDSLMPEPKLGEKVQIGRKFIENSWV